MSRVQSKEDRVRIEKQWKCFGEVRRDNVMNSPVGHLGSLDFV